MIIGVCKVKRNAVCKTLSVILALLFLVSSVLPVCAEENLYVDSDSDVVARLYVCSRKKNFWAMGHAYLYLENLSDQTLTVGAYELPPDEGVSIGTFGFTRADGLGIYYNIEAYVYNTYGGQGVICLSSDLTAEEVERFSHRLLYSNTWDFFFFNCMSFAYMMWNTVASPFLMPLLFPMFGRLQIRIYGSETAPTMFYPPKERVYRMRGTGQNCRLDPVKPKSIAK